MLKIDLVPVGLMSSIKRSLLPLPSMVSSTINASIDMFSRIQKLKTTVPPGTRVDAPFVPVEPSAGAFSTNVASGISSGTRKSSPLVVPSFTSPTMPESSKNKRGVPPHVLAFERASSVSITPNPY